MDPIENSRQFFIGTAAFAKFVGRIIINERVMVFFIRFRTIARGVNRLIFTFIVHNCCERKVPIDLSKGKRLGALKLALEKVKCVF